MAILHNLGFPRIGENRELKFALEKYWRKEIDEPTLLAKAEQVKQQRLAQQSYLDYAQIGDFSLYDNVLDSSFLLGHIPAKVKHLENTDHSSQLESYFAVARGAQPKNDSCCAISAAEMTKWFDTNYHYIVPELNDEVRFSLNPKPLIQQVIQSRKQGYNPKPVIIGPLTYLWLSKTKDGSSQLAYLEKLLPLYTELLGEFAKCGVEWVQIDEPILATELTDDWQWAFKFAYQSLISRKTKLLLTTYFGELKENLTLACQLPIDGLHIDAVRAPDEVSRIEKMLPNDKVLSVGIIDGRNIWKSDLTAKLDILEPLQLSRGQKLWIAPSCSLIHVPISLERENKLPEEVKNWLAFAVDKLDELQLINQALLQGRECIAEALQNNALSIQTRHHSALVNDAQVAQNMEQIDNIIQAQRSPFAQRQVQQRQELNLPLLPTTTIGSFPQTGDIRAVRKQFKTGQINQTQYQEKIKAEIHACIQKQEALGLDVLVHGEAERNDMVEYFGQQLNGFTFSQLGWVQSYGSRCVKPPIIFGDVSRQSAMTVDWINYAQSLTNKPVKGMLTGPVTILNWSFVRDDQARADTCMQIALAIREEVQDLERSGVKIIQIDEAAFREGLPLHKQHWQAYLDNSVNAFKVCSNVVADNTQIHTHMCYSDFNAIIKQIAQMDADVITIETSRSDMALLGVFDSYQYPNEIGPGVYDIHSPNIPSVEAILALLEQASTKIPVENLWVNPDCGLKTRNWDEVTPALKNMLEATKIARARFNQSVA
ncbi:5-methyltetrahydropteroyltriglutamate--homocysteine S-methyltransferase [Paraglaciecola arctica]|uniref:5-methyltetrahydropteroyltriglutamate--homocysteine methyltransferase n=1 Tax=Paraglaciecola arctica BSs20135 TaxID=493475 RepID=K6XGW1_9ALTE|nr:5-methyltetrahydropteroyltriglutamate--homocysteine S-methyltransferase [Paraglaciecola arctica]GAC19869.1 5-methyltetrahydropteroyltriglutamate--homocysteine methyltransferase [Paraglaciecola arctica BSs20135]